jgi:ketosteroid isomerase-like protein
MSRENVEIVRDSWTAFAEDGLEAMAEFWDAEINWRAMEGAPDDVGEINGRDAVRSYCQDWLDTFADLTNVPEELLDVGDDRVVSVQHVTGCARQSGVETELRYAVVYTVRGGKIVRGREYVDRQQALEAVGRDDVG